MIHRLPNRFTADSKKVVLQYFDLQYDRLSDLLKAISVMPDELARSMWNETQYFFGHRHRDFKYRLGLHIEKAERYCDIKIDLKSVKRALFGAYISKEYSTQSAALFNPSIVPHPNQKGVDEGGIRFLMSLRSTGEGHISSISFREGVFHPTGHVHLSNDVSWQTTGHITSDDLQNDADYTVTFPQNIPLQERILFPHSASESMGMEDLRLVQWVDAAASTYIGTYTAYDGRTIQSKMLQTDDFSTFKIKTLIGKAVQGKGIAIFPRKIRQQYVAIGRQDGVTMSIMYSNSLTHWDHSEQLAAPTAPYELIQLGNCGSPIETENGWILLTHAVGPMRRYVLGVTLLDLEYPEKVISKLDLPLMAPLESEREGYVPNVLYTCGWLRNLDAILIPYAMSDASCGFATVSIKALLGILLSKT